MASQKEARKADREGLADEAGDAAAATRREKLGTLLRHGLVRALYLVRRDSKAAGEKRDASKELPAKAAEPLLSVEEVQSYIDRLRGPPVSVPTKVGLAVVNAGIAYEYLITPMSHVSPLATAMSLFAWGFVNACVIGVDKFATHHFTGNKRRERKKRDEYEQLYGTRHPEYKTTDPNAVAKKWREYELCWKLDGAATWLSMGGVALMAGSLVYNNIPKNPYALTPLVMISLGGPILIGAYLAGFFAMVSSFVVGAETGLNTLTFTLARRYLDWKDRRSARKMQGGGQAQQMSPCSTDENAVV